MSERIVLTHVNLHTNYTADEQQCILLMHALQNRAVRQQLVARRDSYLYEVAKNSGFVVTGLRWPWSVNTAQGSDLIHAHDPLGAKWAKRTGIAYIVRQSQPQYHTSSALSGARCALATSRSMIERLFATQLHLPVQRIPPMWDDRTLDTSTEGVADSMSKASTYHKKFNDKVIFGCCTPLTTDSGVLVLVEAMRYLSSRYPQIQLIILGKGPIKSKITQHIRSLDCVSLIDNSPETLPWYNIFDAYVSPALQCGDDNGTVQAMYLGLPIVATKLEAIEDFVQEGISGLLAPSHDYLALAKQMEMIVNDAGLALRLGAAATSHARKFSPAIVAEKTFRIYQTIASMG